MREQFSTTVRLVFGVALGVGVLFMSERLSSKTGTDEITLAMYSAEDFDSYVKQSLLRNPNVLIEVFELLENEQDRQEQQADAALIEHHRDVLFSNAEENGPVIVEFFDYNCGYCRQAHSEMEAVRARHADISVLHMHLPILGQGSVELAKTMMAVKTLYGDDAYQDLHKRLMEDDGRMKARMTVELEQLGFDVEQIAIVAEGPEVTKALESAGQIARSLGISGTPAFVTRSKILRGFAGRSELMNAAL